MNFNPMNPSLLHTEVRVRKIAICQVDGYNDQYVRPMTAQDDRVGLTDSTLRDFSQMVRGADVVTPADVARSAGYLLSPSATPQQRAYIPHGWNERRYRFMMEVEYRTQLGSSIEVVSGFTDYFEQPTLQGGYLDPRMVFRINSVIPLLMTKVVYSGTEQVTQAVPQHWSQVFIPSEEFSVDTGFSYRPNISLAPANVVSGLSLRSYAQYTEDDCLIDTSIAVHETCLSNRSNCDTNRYISKVVNAYRNNMRSAEAINANPREILSSTRADLRDEYVSSDKFIMHLSSLTGRRYTSYFTLGELLQLDSNACNDDIMFVNLKPEVSVHYADTQGLHGADLETVSAAFLASSIPSIMMECGLTKLSFVANNTAVDQPIIVVDANTLTASNFDLTNCIERVKTRILRESLYVMSQRNTVPYTLELKCDVFGDIVINISYNSQPLTPYILPAFADSMFSSLLATDEATLDQLVETFQGVLDIVASESNPYSSAMPTYHHPENHYVQLGNSYLDDDVSTEHSFNAYNF